MHALVITPFGPEWWKSEITGTHWRFRLFVEAISGLVQTIDFLHIVPPLVAAACSDVDRINTEQSAALGLTVSAHVLPYEKERGETFLNHYWAGIWSVHNEPEYFLFSSDQHVAEIIALLARKPDIIFVHRLSGMIPVLRSHCRPARMFFDLDDVVHRMRLQTAFQAPIRPGKLAYLSHVPAIMLAELRGAAVSNQTFVCSEVDRKRLRRLGFPRIAVVPNAMSLPSIPPVTAKTRTILFLGSCWTTPNFNAAERLVQRIFPRVRAAVPEARLLIAGSGTLDLPSRADRPPGVEYFGYVENLADLYASTRVFCCPITSGSGTRVKLIEAAGYARPIVATRFAAEGLDFRDELEILLRENDASIADACIDLMKDDGLCGFLGAAARERMRRNYEATAIREKISNIFRTALRTEAPL